MHMWLSLFDVYLCFKDSNEQNIYDKIQKIKSMAVSLLQNLSQRYFSHNNNIKCRDSTIKYICF